MRRPILITAIFLLCIAPAAGQSYGDLPSDRFPPAGWEDTPLVDTSGWSVLDINDASDVGSGNAVQPNDASTDTAAKLEAIAAQSTAPRIIRFPAGIFYFSTSANLSSSHLILRGAGKGVTTFLIDAPASSNAEIAFSGGGLIGSEIDITNAPVRGDDSFTVSSTSGLSVGDLVHIYDKQRAPAVVISGLPDGYHYGQIVRITGISGNTVTVDMKLGLFLSLDPKLRKIDAAENVGIEDVTVRRDKAAQASRVQNVAFNYVDGGHALRIESSSLEQSGVSGFYSRDIVVQSSDIHDAFDYGTGGQAYGIRMWYGTTRCKIVDNKLWNLRHHIMLDRGANHCVVAYNSAEPNFEPSSTIGDLNQHGFTPHNNLFEGNMGSMVKWDERSNTGFDQRQSVYAVAYRNRLLPSYPGNRILIEDPKEAGNVSHIKPVVVANVTGSITVESGVQNPYVDANLVGGNVSYTQLSASSDYPTSLFAASKPGYLSGRPWPMFGPDLGSGFGASNTLPAFDRAQTAGCLVGTQSGSKSGYFSLQSTSSGRFLTASSSTGNVVTSTTLGDAGRWQLVDGNGDGYFGLVNKSFGTNLEANGSTAVVTTSSGPLSAAVRHWELRDSNQDEEFGVINETYDPNHLRDNGSGSAVSLSPTPFDPQDLWRACPA